MAYLHNTHPVPFLFVHVFRTGGMALRRVLPTGGAEIGGGHNTMDDTQQLMNDNAKWGNLFRFVIVRNPFDWMLSVHAYANGYDTHFMHEQAVSLTFSEWLLRYFREVFNFRNEGDARLNKCTTQTRFAGHNPDMILRTESLERDWLELCDRVQIEPTPIPRFNGVEHPPRSEAYTDEAADIVRRYLYADFVRFGYSTDWRTP